MSIAKITRTRSSIEPDLIQIQKELVRVPQRAYVFFKEHTPIRSGNARRRTVLERDNTIAANYDYATRLDQGLSNQAPDGMSKPTRVFLKREFDKIFKGR
jgi:hypothetical protein